MKITKNFLLQNGYTISKEWYDGSMGFLSCDALGPMVYCVRKSGVLVGYSQLDEDSAVWMAAGWHRNQEIVKSKIYFVYNIDTKRYERAGDTPKKPFLNQTGAKLGIRRLKEFKDDEYEIHEYSIKFNRKVDL